jgi:hypothetical protein
VVFKNLRRWLSGSFVCLKCGRTLHVLSFGFGKTICPECYEGEHEFLIIDKDYFLNRIIRSFSKREEHSPKPVPLQYLSDIGQELEIVEESR